jgi:ATP-dependent Zn protease
MTLALGSILITLALGAGVFLGRRHERQVWVQIIEDREAVDTGKIRNLIEYRVAVHEAGHAVCVWFDPYTRGIDRITIDDGAVGEGRVSSSRMSRATAPSFWYGMVNNLGGIAGEMMEFKRMRSGTAKSDLEKALHKARELVKVDKLDPPWKHTELEDGHFDISTMYRSVDSDTPEARVLNLAYAHARYLLEKDRKRMLQVAGDLAKHGVLEAKGVKRIFGTRAVWPLPFLR